MIESCMLSIAVAIVLYAVLSVTLIPFLQKLDRADWLQHEGIEARAVVLHVQKTKYYSTNFPQVRLQMNIKSATGQSFVAETKQVISPTELNRLHAGSYVKVKYNPHNIKEMVILR